MFLLSVLVLTVPLLSLFTPLTDPLAPDLGLLPLILYVLLSSQILIL